MSARCHSSRLVLPGVVFLALLAPAVAAQGFKLSSPLARPIGGDIRTYDVSPDGARVVYVADEDVDEVFELYVAKPNAAGTRRKLAGPAIEGGSVSQVWIGPKSRHVVFTGDLETDGLRELYSVPIDGGARVKLASPPPWSSIASVQIDSAETRVLFVARLAASSVRRGVFSVPIGGGPAILLSDPALDVVTLQVAPDGRRAVYVTGSVLELFSVPVLGGLPVRLSPAGVRVDSANLRIDPRSARVVFADVPATPAERRLYSAPLGGRSPAVQLLPHPLRSPELVRISADATRVVCIAVVGTALELTSVPIDGRPGSAVLFDVPTPSEHFVSVELASDARTVVFETFANTRGALHRAPIDGSQPAIELAETIPNGNVHSADSLYVFFQTVAGHNSARIDVPAAPVQLASHSAVAFEVTADSTRVVYEGFEGTNYRLQLFSVPIDGGKAPVRLHPELPYGGAVENLGPGPRMSSVTGRVIYRASLERRDQFELFSAPVDGGAGLLRINGQLPIGSVEGDVWRMALSSDGVHAVYVADQETDQVVELFSVRTDGRGAPIKLCEPLAVDQHVFTFAITPDGSRVVYRIDELQGPLARLWVVPIDGGASTPLTAPLETGGALLVDPTGTRVVFEAGSPRDVQLYSVPLDASSPPVSLGGPRPFGTRITTPDGSRVLFLSEVTGDSGAELFSVPIDGSAAAVRLDLPSVTDGGVQPFEVDALGERVVFLQEAFARAVLGAGRRQRERGPAEPGARRQPSRLVVPARADGLRLLHQRPGRRAARAALPRADRRERGRHAGEPRPRGRGQRAGLPGHAGRSARRVRGRPGAGRTGGALRHRERRQRAGAQAQRPARRR